MIKAVLFDFGGVLTEGGKAGSIKASFAKLYRIGEQQVVDDPAGARAMRGEMTDEAFMDAMNRHHPSAPKATVKDFLNIADIFDRCSPVYQLAAALRDHGIRTGILSNTLSSSAAQLRTQGYYEGFDPVLLSYDVGLLKPEPAIYQLAADRLGLPPEQILFIDDVEPYVAAARKLGMQTIWAHSPQQIVEDTKALLAKENDLHL